MPKGIRKQTPKTIHSEIEKQQISLQQKERMITACRQECAEKVKAWKHEIAVGQSQIRRLNKEYDNAVLEEQRKLISAILFSSRFTADEISEVIAAVEILFTEPEKRQEAVGMIQRIAEKHHSSAISNLVSEAELPEGTTVRGPGASTGCGADVRSTMCDFRLPDSETEVF